MKPDAKTVRWLSNLGWFAGIVERRTGQITRDLYGFADIHAFALDGRELLVQATTTSNLSARVRKVEANETARAYAALVDGRELTETAVPTRSVCVVGWYPNDRMDPSIRWPWGCPWESLNVQIVSPVSFPTGDSSCSSDSSA